ncbi:hypothetical protein C1645_839414 [Glomus cerebriforme]|uniref:Uncharacterized protein n=1 Tax=Glomus cerebriforme TaxID=658196 RepID=A0A397S3G5_9GLOM|nr:hypothetical protein C1645_839414 [Glomus cerebriforme]
MDDKNENDLIIQEFERKLKIEHETQDIQVEKSWNNPYPCEEKFDLIRPMYDLVVNQMNVISTCFSVHSHIAFTEENEKNLSENIMHIPQQLSDILFESTNIRNNLIEIIGAMEQLSNGIARFVKIANNQKLQDKSLIKFLHFVETPGEKLKGLLNKECELNHNKITMFKENLDTFMESSGSKTIPDWIKQQAQCKKELKDLENEKQKKFIEDIVEYDEVAKIISEIEFYQTQLVGHEHLKNDIQNEKKTLQANRDLLERQAITSATSSNFIKVFLFMRNNDLDVLRKQKNITKKEITEIMSQESQRILYEAEIKKKIKSLSEKLESAKKKVEKAKIIKDNQLKAIDDQIKKKEIEVKKFENKIHQMLEKYGNPSIKATCLLLESITRLTEQQVQNKGNNVTAREAVKSFLEMIEDEIKYIREVEGDRDVLDDEWISMFKISIAPLNFFISEIRPVIRNSINGKALEPAFNTNLRIEY